MAEVHWPAVDPTITFDEAVDDAISRQVPLLIAKSTIITLTERILLKTNGATLRLVGVSGGDIDNRPTIISSAHSLFQVGGRGATLVLANLILRHTCFREEYKDIGAVIFSLHKAKVHVSDCEIHSDHGFGIWAVQRAMVRLNNCVVISSSRSGCVSFGRSSLSMIGCTIRDCRIHGVCSRGSTVLTLEGCLITSSGIRGLYAYHNVNLSMVDTTVTRTQSCDHAAVDLWGCDLENLCRDSEKNDTDILEDDFIDVSMSPNSNVRGSILAAEGIERILDTVGDDLNESCTNIHMMKSHPEGLCNHANYSRKFKHSSSLQNLTLKMVDCVISDNNGIGLRIRHGRGQSDGRISGSIISCKLHNNRAGNIREISSPVNSCLPTNSPALESSHLQDCSLTDISELGKSLASNLSVAETCTDELVTTEDDKCSQVRGFVWEYERDDPATMNNKSNQPVMSPGSSGSMWQMFDRSVSEYIQSSYEMYLVMNAEAMVQLVTVSSACHDIQIDCTHSNSCRNCVKNDDDDDDGDDDDICSRDLEPKNRTVHLPEPFFKYVVDFKRMQQTNTHTHYMRAIRRRGSQT